MRTQDVNKKEGNRMVTEHKLMYCIECRTADKVVSVANCRVCNGEMTLIGAVWTPNISPNLEE